MNKNYAIWPFAILMSLGITGCGANQDTAVQDRSTNMMQSVGYYSNENHQNRGGNALMLDSSDNDGPVIEIMDRSLGAQGERAGLDKSGESIENVNNPQSNVNGNGRLNKTETKLTDHSQDGVKEGELAERVNQAVSGVDNVSNVHTVLRQNDVNISVVLENDVHKTETKEKIRKVVQPLVNGKKITIETDQKSFNRLER